MSRPDSIQSRMRRMVVASCGFMAAVLAVTLALVLVYNGQYKNLLYNVTTASEFNQDFKENIDLKMYYYVIESRYSEGLPIQEVQAAQALARDLLDSTSQKDSLQAVTSVLDLCENLEEKIYQIEQTQSYDSRQMQLENNIYVLTALIQEYMYNYLYYESVRLNLLLQQISRQITAEILLVALLSAVLIALLARYSVRLSRSVAQPVVDLSRRAEDVIGGDLTVREPVRSETYEIRTLSEGMEQMIARINAQIQEITQKQTSLRKAELALLQAQINPHFLYNTMDTIIWLIEADRPQAAVEMVSNLSSFFRHSLSRGEDIITLGEEADALIQITDDGAGMTPARLEELNRAIASGEQVDYIVLMPISESGWDSVLQEAKEAGIPVILVDRMVDVEDESLYAAHIGSDFLKEGRLAVAWMEDAFREAEDPVRVIHIQGTLGSTAQLGRTAALEEAVETHENWELPAQMDGDFTQAKTYEVMTEYLSSLPGGRDIDVVYCENDNIAFGALQALEEQGYACGPDGVSIITFDATRGALTECLNGRIALAVECNPLLGPLVETVIQDMEAGRTPEKHSFVEEQVFTSENLTAALVESRAY